MPPYEEEEDSEEDEVSEEEEDIVAFMPKKKVRGRKTNWSNNITDNLIDIILDDKKLKTKLLLTNSKSVTNGHYYTLVLNELRKRHPMFSFDVAQTRGRFKGELY